MLGVVGDEDLYHEDAISVLLYDGEQAETVSEHDRQLTGEVAAERNPENSTLDQELLCYPVGRGGRGTPAD